MPAVFVWPWNTPTALSCDLGCPRNRGKFNAARLPEVAADPVRLKPDLIVTRASFFTGALKAATSSIPIVFVGHADPVGTGHVASLARPGGNITGMAVLQTELGPKGLELLHSVVPAAARISVLWHPGTPSAGPRAQGAGAAAPLAAAAHRSADCRRAGGRLLDHGPRRHAGRARIRHPTLHHRETAAGTEGWPLRTGCRQCAKEGSSWRPAV